jgi:hypothetical protein
MYLLVLFLLYGSKRPLTGARAGGSRCTAAVAAAAAELLVSCCTKVLRSNADIILPIPEVLSLLPF